MFSNILVTVLQGSGDCGHIMCLVKDFCLFFPEANCTSQGLA